ncbi:exocyst complex component 3-like [Centruroides sculpturatus]|uniref:exocyst complex component 3-like n=1 Tax=Centruroides sculpturatus TaxID=218467 RepID=UPI000C6CCF41|nr:exocyst complex component 3-like [Centruroides sculpturatus]
MDVAGLEAEAKATAAKHVANMLQRPDQLEKVEQYKRRVGRKKASVEAMLKTAMQTQLDGVKLGLNQLQTALQDIQDIKSNLKEIEGNFQVIPLLAERLQDVREESMKHSQTSEQITWQAEMQCLADLENSRDDLLFEMHKLPSRSPTDRNMLKQYFADVEKMSEELSKQLWLILKRTLNSVRKEPQVIVTALRIIEREERADTAALVRHKTTGFLPPGRPKKWRQRAFEVLKQAVAERIEGNQLEERAENKMWLVRHLEVTRQLVIEDLRVVKTACVPCFPPEYDIVIEFVKMYHDCLSKHLQDIIANELEGNEHITILNWLNTYESAEMLGHPDLNIDVKKLGPLLENNIVENLIDEYLKNLNTNYQDWMKNTLASEVKDWQREIEPEKDGENLFHTSLPVIVFHMIDQHVSKSAEMLGHPDLNIDVKKLGPLLENNIVENLIDEYLKNLNTNYQDWMKNTLASEVKDWQREIEPEKDGENLFHTSLPVIVFHMIDQHIAIANNCLQFRELAQGLRQRYWKPNVHDNEAEKIFQKTLFLFEKLREEVLDFLLEELFLDLDREFNDLVTKKWLMTGKKKLNSWDIPDSNHCPKASEKQIISLFWKKTQKFKISLKNYEERKETAEKIIVEGGKLKSLFSRLSSSPIKRDSPFDALPLLAEVLKLKDASLLSLEISGLIKRYPDISVDQLTALVTLRGDVGRAEAKQLVTEMIPEAGSNTEVKSIFSEIQF